MPATSTSKSGTVKLGPNWIVRFFFCIFILILIGFLIWGIVWTGNNNDWNEENLNYLVITRVNRICFPDLFANVTVPGNFSFLPEWMQTVCNCTYLTMENKEKGSQSQKQRNCICENFNVG